MICPKCKNTDFNETDDVRKPLRNIGGKESYDTVDYRRYICLQCGYAFITAETFERDLHVRRNQLEIFNNGYK